MELNRRQLMATAVAISTAIASTRKTFARRTATMPQAEEFKIVIPDADLQRLKRRVREAKMPMLSRDAGWTYGVDKNWFADLVRYWGSEFNWRTAEAELNTFAHYRAVVSGRKLHFVRIARAARSPQRPIPMLLLHGWPYTFLTMLPLATRLAAEGYDVIVPSLPGVAFSEAPDDKVRGLRFISGRIDRLMTDVLGYPRYLIHGGDHGAVVADWLAIDAADHVAGIHANMIAFRHAGASYGSGQTGVADPTPEESAYVKAEVENMERESAYFRLQATRPETIAYALTDSPVGWAAYMLDKWQKWSDTRNRPFEAIYDRNRLLTEAMLFLVTNSVATSLWPYAGFFLEPFGLEPGQTIDVPFGYSSFHDPLLPRMPRHFVERSRPNIKLWQEHQTGGHFPMLERTEALAADIVKFAESL